MPLKHYTTTKPTSLSAGMTAGDTAVYLTDGSTYPDPAVPSNDIYTVIIGYGSEREEVCTVTAKPATNQLTVTRAQDGSSATSKNAGDVVVHGVSARDFAAPADAVAQHIADMTAHDVENRIDTEVGTAVPAAVTTAIKTSTSPASGTPAAGEVLWVQI